MQALTVWEFTKELIKAGLWLWIFAIICLIIGAVDSVVTHYDNYKKHRKIQGEERQIIEPQEGRMAKL